MEHKEKDGDDDEGDAMGIRCHDVLLKNQAKIKKKTEH